MKARTVAFPLLAVIAMAAVVLGAAAAAGGGKRHFLAEHYTPPAAHPVPKAKFLRVSRAKDFAPAGLVVVGGRLLTPSSTALASEAVGPLMGWLVPVAVASPDGRKIVYSAWRELRSENSRLSWSEQGIKFGDPLGLPAVRIYDLASGADRLVQRGAFSAAWRGDGALSYVRGSRPEYRAGAPYIGDIVVRRSATGPAETWTETADRYVVAAWAGRTLIAYRIREGEQLDLIALDGPRQQRVLASDMALVAVSPDGRSAFVTDVSTAPGTVRILAVADGDEVARLTLGEIGGVMIPTVDYAGSWVGEHVVAGSEEGLVVFRIAGRSIEPVRVLRLDRQRYPHGAIEPVFVSGGSRVVARTDVRAGPEAPSAGFLTTLLDCDLVTATCVSTGSAPERSWLRFVSNPSRPGGGQ